MKLTRACGANLTVFVALATGAVSWAQTLDTPSGGVRDGSDTAGSGDPGPVQVRPTPGGGVELTVPATPPTRKRSGENIAEREVRKDNQVDAADHVIEEPQNLRYSTRPPGTSNVTPANQWRYRFVNNHWWYWQPNNTWVFYVGNRWVPYNPDIYGQYYPRATSSANMGPRAQYYADEALRGTTPGAGGPVRSQSAYRGNYYSGGTSLYSPSAGAGVALPSRSGSNLQSSQNQPAGSLPPAPTALGNRGGSNSPGAAAGSSAGGGAGGAASAGGAAAADGGGAGGGGK